MYSGQLQLKYKFNPEAGNTTTQTSHHKFICLFILVLKPHIKKIFGDFQT